VALTSIRRSGSSAQGDVSTGVPARAAQLGIELLTLDELLARADFISVHLPKTPETAGLIGKEALAKTKPGLIIVNAARGGLIDEEALAEAVRSGHVRAAGIDVLPFEQDHGTLSYLGFRFGPIAYANDVVGLPEAAFAAMAGVEVLIVDATRYKPHPTHAHLDLTLEWIARISPRRAFLTNLHVDMDYAELDRRTPANVRPCYDGLIIES
jgi:hypothetical protein